jgi:Ca-activated chloride channel family protein
MPVALTKPIFLLFLLFIPVIWIMMSRSSFKDQPWLGRIFIGGLHSLLILILGLALSDPRMIKTSDRVNLFFCMDVSESVGSDGKKAAMEFMQEAALGMGEEDRAGLILFGERPSLEIALRRDFDPRVLKSQVNTKVTNMYKALQCAVGKLPAEGKNRIVLLSDGNENVEDSTEMAYLASSIGIEIYPLPLTSFFTKSEVFVEELETPPTVPLETPFDIRLHVMSTGETTGELILLRNGRLMSNLGVRLQSGKNVFRFMDTIGDHGLYLYKAVINAPEDALFQNNEGLSFTQGTRKSEVLYLTGEKRAASHLAQALFHQGLSIVQKTIEDLPPSIHGLLDYSAIILDNVSGQALSLTAMENLEKYVKDLGGGLVMIGGDKSFGAGHYMSTPVEKALPVFMDAPTDLDFPGLCLILIIDKSSSMAGSITRESKLEGAKIAAFSTVEMLNPMDKIGILAFDMEFQWIVPVTQASERREVVRKLSMLKGEGGTDLYPGLKEAFNVLKGIPAAKKHVIVLSDGLTNEADFRSVIRSMREAQITISTVAVGSDSNLDLMKAIAEWGGGRSYYTEDIDKIPRIFVGETKIAAKKAIVEKVMHSYAVMEDEMTLAIPTDELPLVSGLVVTYPKPGARVLFTTQEGPLLVAWQYGLGRGVAFTSDLSGRWGRDWVLWEHYGKFVSQMVKWVQRKEVPRNYAVNITRRGGEGTFTVDVTDDQNRFINNLDLKIRVLFPSKADRITPLDQVAPGRYCGSFPAMEIGEYYFSLFGTDGEGFSESQTFGYGIPYTDEFTRKSVNYALLERLASITKGRVLKPGDNSRDLFTANSNTTEYGSRLWPYLTIASLLVLIAEVFLRKFQSLGRITFSGARGSYMGEG